MLAKVLRNAAADLTRGAWPQSMRALAGNTSVIVVEIIKASELPSSIDPHSPRECRGMIRQQAEFGKIHIFNSKTESCHIRILIAHGFHLLDLDLDFWPGIKV